VYCDPIDTQSLVHNLFAVRVKMVNMFLYIEEKNVIAIDSCYKPKILKREFDKIGINPNEVNHLFLTHSDYDHSGGLDLFPNAKIYLPAVEEQMITRITPRRLWIYNWSIKRKYKIISDKDIINLGPTKVQAILTPGHTPGSTCYLINNQVLFTGDSLRINNGKAQPFYTLFNMDTKTQKESIKKLTLLKNVEILCTAHSGFSKNFEESIKGLTK
jgi:hydroxyacylglutathione hydrolase